MGTTLTGTKPKDTYDSLIKVEDNGPISGTAKYLSDGLGNNLPIAVSTSNVGIGTSAPTEKLSISGNGFFGGTNAKIYIDNGGVGGAALVVGVTGSTNGYIATDGNFPILIQPNNTTRVRIDADGLKFNADTAAANALDDYEEGTWTPVYRQDATPNTATYTSQVGTYTKIGNIVTVFFDMSASSITAGAGFCNISGLPFTVNSGMAGYSYGGIRDPSALSGSLTNAFGAFFAEKSNTYLRLFQISTLTGQEVGISAYAASGRITGTIQYTV
jgi:hypothetical protein